MSERTGLQMLRARGLVPKRALGQNFLTDGGLAHKIACLATTPPGGTVLEIGAGLGALTIALAKRAARVVAIERDAELLPILRARLGGCAGLRLVHGDATRLDWAPLLANGPRPHSVAGNLPYAITGRLMVAVVRLAPHIDRAVVMVQREVAERLMARPGGRVYGAPSVFAQAAFAVERVARAAPGAFSPVPRVASTVLLLRPHARARARETDAFRLVVKSAFGKRRKTLRNAWRGLAGLPPEQVESMARSAHIDLGARAESLTVEDYAAMAAALEPLMH